MIIISITLMQMIREVDKKREREREGKRSVFSFLREGRRSCMWQTRKLAKKTLHPPLGLKEFVPLGFPSKILTFQVDWPKKV